MSTPINIIDKCMHVYLPRKNWFLRYSGELTQQKVNKLAANLMPQVLKTRPYVKMSNLVAHLKRYKPEYTCNQVQFFRDAVGGVYFRTDNSSNCDYNTGGEIEDGSLCIIAEDGTLEPYTDVRAKVAVYLDAEQDGYIRFDVDQIILDRLEAKAKSERTSLAIDTFNSAFFGPNEDGKILLNIEDGELYFTIPKTDVYSFGIDIDYLRKEYEVAIENSKPFLIMSLEAEEFEKRLVEKGDQFYLNAVAAQASSECTTAPVRPFMRLR